MKRSVYKHILYGYGKEYHVRMYFSSVTGIVMCSIQTAQLHGAGDKMS